MMDRLASATVTEDGAAPRPILRLAELRVRFGGVEAIAGLSTSFYQDEVCGLIGPNGAGKTTLFDVIAGVTAPTTGMVEYEGNDVTRRSPTWLARHGIRRTFQRQQTFGWLSVEDNVLAALEWRGGGGGLMADLLHSPSRRSLMTARRRQAREALELCGIGALAARPASQLPIGQARMVEVARAVVDRPKLLLLDEPTSGLKEEDAEHLGHVLDLVRRELTCSLVLVEHNMRFVMKHSARVIVMNLGQVLAEGTPDEVMNNPAVLAAYLG